MQAQEVPARERDLPSLPTQQQDTLSTPSSQDSLQISLPQSAKARGDIETTIKYNAKDSIIFDALNRIVYLYGGAVITYGDIKLEAARITIDWTSSTLAAVGVTDSLGKDVGKPVFTQGAETYVTDNIRYNFKTRKALIKGVVTQQEEAYIHGDFVKRDANNHLHIKGARYTTCNLEHPHFYIQAEKLKMMPNDKIVAGPFHLKIADISTPLGFVFGMFPVPRKRVSGVIIPSYGEENRRGFFLRDGGYYFAINDYLDLAVTGEAYTKGSRGFQIASNYRKRYQYAGNFSLRYNRQNQGEEGEENISKDFWVSWSHNPQTKGASRFSASVNAGTSSFTNNNPSLNNFERNLNQQFSSNISYSNSLPGTPFNLSARASLVQDVVRNTADLLLPEVGLTMQRQYPAQWFGRTGRSWWEQINFSYTGTATNRISNRAQATSISGFRIAGAPTDLQPEPIPLNAENIGTLFRRANNGVRHAIPVSTSLNLLKHFTLTPSFNYQEVWNFRELRYTDFDAERGGIGVDTVSGFSRASSWNLNAGLNTKFYGMFYFNKRNPTPKVQAIRHMVIPTVGFSYAPDFGDARYGTYQNVVVGRDPAGNIIERQLSIYQGFAYDAPQAGRQGSITFGVSNNFEMKVREKGDTATTYKKVPLLERLNFSTSYNLLRDSLKLAPISISGNTSLFNNLITINFGGQLNPYLYRIDSTFRNRQEELQIVQSQVDKLAIANGRGLGRLEQVNVGLSTNLSSAGLKGDTRSQSQAANTAASRRGLDDPLGEGEAMGEDLGQEGLAYRYMDPSQYVDFTLPWTLRLSYTLSYQKRGYQPTTIVQSANFSGDLKVTEKWKVGYTSGYDFTNHEFTATRLSIFRDLHCWQMNVNWVPFGRFQSFSVDIRVKSAVLQDLKLSRRRSFWDQ
ncbi:putative LPS assembly protein LptD [Cesiribacter andamanensis]|uniref:putative LPS assembly protein LptD n=1 Tax=Cesiribacter andamanensis TaxID=649507 RepID=UPI001F3B4935|nr:putative LPS assembly protein LptD [Cesiribacter andamanensis]